MPGCFGRELLLGALLVGVGPVEDLFLDELARGQRLERRAGEVEVGLGRDGQELGLLLREFARGPRSHPPGRRRYSSLASFLATASSSPSNSSLAVVAPRAEVVLVEHHQVPLHLVEPFVLRLDVPRLVAAKQVLEGAEIDHRLPAADLRRVAVGVAGEVLPAVEVHVGFEVRLPSILDGRLESHHEHALGAELLGELVGW